MRPGEHALAPNAVGEPPVGAIGQANLMGLPRFEVGFDSICPQVGWLNYTIVRRNSSIVGHKWFSYSCIL